MSEDLKEERTCALNLGTKSPGKRNYKCKGPRGRFIPRYLRKSEAANVTEAEQMRKVLTKK